MTGENRWQPLHRHAPGARVDAVGNPQTGPLEPARAVSIIGQIAAALDAAHSEGLIHRDVNPATSSSRRPTSLTSWISVSPKTKGDSRLTMAGSQIGSFAYMAPERFNDEGATPASDVYS